MQPKTVPTTPVETPLPISQHEKIQFRARLMMQGKTVAAWCLENQLDTNAVYRCLRGLNKGHYGLSFHAVIAIRTFLTDQSAL